ncbi:nuclear protein 96-domain-containing protein [Pisolithus thermaeus]|nr:nuclear protein 96-domain-containing protein [Pisolithus thermaeus]
MARFSALASDSSDDEYASYASQAVRPTNNVKKPVGEVSESSSSHSDGDDANAILVDGQEDEEEDEEDEDEGESSSEMDENELVLYRPKRTRNHAPAEDLDAEGRYSHPRHRSHSSTSSESETEGQRPVDSAATSWAQTVGVDVQKMHVMQTSLFRMPEEAATLQAMSRPTLPRFRLTPGVTRKHSRDSLGEGRLDSQERASFAHDIEPPVYRPSRKYARVEISDSAVAGCEDALVDAGLALGRSFRVGWGPSGTIAHLGQLCGPSSQVQSSANSSVVTLASAPFFSSARDEASDRLSRLLQHHLSKTPIVKDEYGVPFADPSSELCFSSFATIYPQTNTSYEASLFRLGHALFDPFDLRFAPEITVDVRNRMHALRRKAALSAWLEEAVTSSVNADLNQVTGDPGSLIFTLLTGHQIEKACEIALDWGLVKLATLISQAPGDFEFREDLREQLQIWREQRTDVHINENTRKLYAILAGSTDILEGSRASSFERCSDVDPLKGLDWKRTFGMYLWFAEPMDAPISQVYEAYHRASQELLSRVASPLPHYLECRQGASLPFHLPRPAPSDALFSLIRLHAEPACSLSQILDPLSFSPSPCDYSLPWHLYIVLSRCMRVRDLSDRGSGERRSPDYDEETGRYEGHSPSADLLASCYAYQLEQLGMLQEAVFVLLHIEGSAGREKAIKDLLRRSADKLDDWMTSGILGSLKIPLTWVNEAKALYAIYKGDIFEAYQLYMASGLYQAAHDLAVAQLAPEAVIQHDFEFLTSLFERMSSQTVDGWYLKGKAYMDYAHAMIRLRELHASLSDTDGLDAAEEQELECLARSIPKLIGILPELLPSPSDPRHMVALSEMISGLTANLDQMKPFALSQVRLTGADEETRLRHIQASALERLMRSIQVA